MCCENLNDFMIENKKVLIFDFDETIGTLRVNWKKVKSDIHDLYKKMYNIDYDSIWISDTLNKVYKRFGKEAKEAANNLIKSHELKNLKEFAFNNKVRDFIVENSNKYIIVVWSGNSSDIVKHALNEIIGCFKLIIGREEVGLLKPEPEGLDLILKKFDVKREDCLLIGNSHVDEGAARNGGIDFVHIDDFLKEIQ